jgi:hypothetical protein
VTQTTPEAIRTAAQAFNAEYPEAAEEIAAGTPELHVSQQSVKGGLRVVATLGVRLADGGFAAAEDPQMLASSVRPFDSRDYSSTVTWLVRRHYGRPAVPVTVTRHI